MMMFIYIYIYIYILMFWWLLSFFMIFDVFVHIQWVFVCFWWFYWFSWYFMIFNVFVWPLPHNLISRFPPASRPLSRFPPASRPPLPLPSRFPTPSPASRALSRFPPASRAHLPQGETKIEKCCKPCHKSLKGEENIIKYEKVWKCSEINKMHEEVSKSTKSIKNNEWCIKHEKNN